MKERVCVSHQSAEEACDASLLGENLGCSSALVERLVDTESTALVERFVDAETATPVEWLIDTESAAAAKHACRIAQAGRDNGKRDANDRAENVAHVESLR